MTMKNIGRNLLAALVLSALAAPQAMAANLIVTADTPVSFRATLTGLDTDAATIAGNDFQVFTFKFWTVLVNLRGDGVNTNGAFGFYEIQLTHTGSLAPDATAPIVKTSLVYVDLQPAVVLTDKTVSSQPHAAGAEYLSTTVNIVFDPGMNSTTFSGSISGDSDLDGDGAVDSKDTDQVVDTLKGLKNAGVITGQEMGQIIKQTKQPVKR
jgi:hypothetical protein